MVFAVLGTSMLALLGIVGGIWAEKFDHLAAITNFVVMPMTFLSGTFYSIDQLMPFWAGVAHFNPFFFMIDGFRSGFIGGADASAVMGIVVLSGVNILLWGIALIMLRSGYKIKS
jgi:ABC-2 type transport system permease protein